MTIRIQDQVVEFAPEVNVLNAQYQVSKIEHSSGKNAAEIFAEWAEKKIQHNTVLLKRGLTIVALTLTVGAFSIAPLTTLPAAAKTPNKTATITLQAVPAIKWGTSLEAAKAESKKSGKPILVDFYTDWCGWCTRLDETTYQDDRIKLLGQEVIPVRLDAEGDSKALAEKYKIEAYPTLLFLDASGKEIERVTGYEDGDDFSATMAGVLYEHRNAQLLETTFSSPHDASALARMTIVLAGTERFEEANQFLTRAATEDPNRRLPAVAAAYKMMADTFFGRNEWKQAIPYFEEFVQRSHELREAILGQLMLAVCYVKNNQSSQAISLLNAIKSNPQAIAEEKEVADKILDMARSTTAEPSIENKTADKSPQPAGARATIEA